MKNNIEKVFLQGVVALQAIYEDDLGDITKVIAANGEVFYDKRKLQFSLLHLCRLFNIHPSTLKYTYGKVIGRKNLVPIPLSATEVLFAVKTRKPRIKGDSAYSYVQLQCVESLTQAADTSTILKLTPNVEIHCRESIESITAKMREANLVTMLYRQKAAGGNHRRAFVVAREIEGRYKP